MGLILGLLPACQPERLIVIKVDPSDELMDNASIRIAKIEGRKSPDYEETQHLDFTDHDGGTTIFPVFLGVYLKERSTKINVRVFAYAESGDAVVAAGEQDDLMLNDDRTQFIDVAQEVVLHSCQKTPLCGSSPPDGGDAETGTGAAPTCTDYCTAAINLCPMLFPKGQPQCEASCVDARLGSNQLACLIDFIGRALSTDQCADVSLVGGICAGPEGRCAAYCQFGSSVCGEQSFPPECVTECVSQHLPAGSAESPRSDNSLLCRVSWLEDAIDNPDLCAHALPAGPCQAQ